jgi:hypothetical protein
MGGESGSAFYHALKEFAKRESGGNEEMRREIMERFFLDRRESIAAFNKGWVLQYTVEIILKIVGNGSLSVEEIVQDKENGGRLIPDLLYEYPGKKKAMIIDIKLQTTTQGIEKDKVNYGRLIEERYQDGGNLIFLCLNGPSLPSEFNDSLSKVKVRYFHLLPFLDRLTDPNRNEILLKLVRSDENQKNTQLSEDKLEKLKQIRHFLAQLKSHVSGEVDYQGDGDISNLDLAAVKAADKLKRLAKQDCGDTEIMQMDFEDLLST